jgi:fumarate hydratase class I
MIHALLLSAVALAGAAPPADPSATLRGYLGRDMVFVEDAAVKEYLGSIGGPAALLAQSNIKKVELVAFEELGMEAIRKIEVVDFPAFIIVDDKGNDFFQQLENKGGAQVSGAPTGAGHH